LPYFPRECPNGNFFADGEEWLEARDASCHSVTMNGTDSVMDLVLR
jgi:capsule polysaccharide modification protein KpsS